MTRQPGATPALFRSAEVERMQRSHDATVRDLERRLQDALHTIATLTAKGRA